MGIQCWLRNIPSLTFQAKSTETSLESESSVYSHENRTHKHRRETWPCPLSLIWHPVWAGLKCESDYQVGYWSMLGNYTTVSRYFIVPWNWIRFLSLRHRLTHMLILTNRRYPEWRFRLRIDDTAEHSPAVNLQHKRIMTVMVNPLWHTVTRPAVPHVKSYLDIVKRSVCWIQKLLRKPFGGWMHPTSFQVYRLFRDIPE